MPIGIVIAVLVALFFLSAIRILREYERGVIFRLGRYVGSKGPGLIILIPFIDKMEKVSLRTIAMDIDPQDIITRDNVSVKINAVLYFRVMYPEKRLSTLRIPLRYKPDISDYSTLDRRPVRA
jgi:regulator of protease activity HflC (stomatin/prohibitin superfamily)